MLEKKKKKYRIKIFILGGGWGWASQYPGGKPVEFLTYQKAEKSLYAKWGVITGI